MSAKNIRFLLSGNEQPKVWVPDHETRQDRAIERRRIQVGQKQTRVKSQVQMILKRAHLCRPDGTGKGWTRAYRSWLTSITDTSRGVLQCGDALALESLLRELAWAGQEFQM